MNQFLEAVGIALRAIWANKLRSFLTVLGNIVAVSSIIAVVALIRGMNATVQKVIVSEAGADSFQIGRVGVITDPEESEKARRNNPLVTRADAEAVRRFSPAIDLVMAKADRQGEVSHREHVLESVKIEGVSEDYLHFSGYGVERGRMLTPTEVERRRPVALLGWETADRLFGQADPLERIIKIKGVHFRVVGVCEKKGVVLGHSQDEFVVIPLGAFEKLFGARQTLNLLVRPSDPSLLQKAMDDARVALRVHRRLKAKEKDNFGMFTSETLVAIYRQATTGIFAVLVGVVALALVVGGIVIMNIMLMAVTERTWEIGLRKAVGARRRDITWQILTESITLSTTGGVVGTGLGFLAAILVARLTPLPAAVEAWSVALGISITALVGLFFGLYPALAAARLDPVEALRRE